MAVSLQERSVIVRAGPKAAIPVAEPRRWTFLGEFVRLRGLLVPSSLLVDGRGLHDRRLYCNAPAMPRKFS
jgi:hypothetical protein